MELWGWAVDSGGYGRHSGGFLLRIMPPSWHPVPACARHDHFAGGPFFFAATKIRVGCRHLLLCDGCGRGRCHSGGFLLRIMPPSWHPVPACAPRLRCRRAVLYRHDDYAAAIRKSGPEIKNRCTKEGVNRQNHASILKSGPEIKNRCIGGGGGVLQAGHLLCGNED